MKLEQSQVVIKTLGREINNAEGFFNQEITILIQTEGWLELCLTFDEKEYIGPFCYTPEERDIPF